MPSTSVTNLPFLLWVARGTDWQLTECSNTLQQACTEADASLVGMPLSDLIGTAAAAEVKNWSAIQGGADAPLQLSAVIRRGDGSELFVELSIVYIKNSTPPSFAFLAMEHMASAAAGSRTDTAVADQAKFDALSLVAQGMGHEINNPLQIILGNTEHLVTLTQDPALLSALQDILSAGERIKSAVANLKDFVRTQEK